MTFLRAFARDRSGASLIEFALVAPILAVVAVLVFDVWSAAQAASKLNGALHAGAEYALSTPTTDSAIRTIALAAWTDRPGDGEVQVSRQCKCGTAVNACSGLCASTTSPPSIYVTLTGTATGVGILMSQPVDQTKVIRVR